MTRSRYTAHQFYAGALKTTIHKQYTVRITVHIPGERNKFGVGWTPDPLHPRASDVIHPVLRSVRGRASQTMNGSGNG